MTEGLESCHVLVVEDDVGIQQLLIGSALESMGITDVAFAENGAEGLAKLEARMPDLIVLDIEMPVMNGHEMLRLLRGSDDEIAQIPVIVQSATESTDRRDQMFQEGATDFVLKPISIKEFQARVRVHLENRLHLKRVKGDLARIAQELEDAAQLQRALLPTAVQLATLRQTHGIGIDYLFAPSSQLGGDFWGVLPINENAVGLYICDFAGHGVRAAMNVFQLHALLGRVDQPRRKDPATFVAAVNRALHSSMRQRQYATFLFAVIDLKEGKIRYCACASPDPLCGNRGSDEINRLDGSGMPLGILPDITPVVHEIDFPPGSFLFLYSDALSEQVSIEGHMPSIDDVKRFVGQVAQHPFRTASLGEDICRYWTGDAPLDDDLTAIWIERLEE